jgi:glucokinase
MLLAGDVGGTKTLLGLFEPMNGRPKEVATRSFTTLDHPALIDIIRAFTTEIGYSGRFSAACFGVAGPVLGSIGELTNVPWQVDANEVAAAFDIRGVALLNDLEAMAYGVPLLESQDLHTLQQGTPRGDGNIAVIAAGTGLGQALLHNVSGRYVPSPGEGGHADFAARNDREVQVLRALTAKFGRTSIEHVLSGRGLENLHGVTHRGECAIADRGDTPDAPQISEAALTRRCAGCVEALEIFVDVYGAESGNHALRSMSTGGVFVGGGIAPKILPALDDGRFMRAFRNKPPHVELLSAMPVHVILNTDTGLLGAAVRANALL